MLSFVRVAMVMVSVHSCKTLTNIVCNIHTHIPAHTHTHTKREEKRRDEKRREEKRREEKRREEKSSVSDLRKCSEQSRTRV